MRGPSVMYKLVAASQLWYTGNGQQVPLGISTATTNSMHPFMSSAALLVATPINTLENPKGVGRLPALGWNSWNAFHCDINDAKIFTAAQQLVALGLKDVGYEYVNIDDCWSVKDHRDPITQELIPDPVKFPRGIAGLATEVHSLGLKFGIYGSAGTLTCASYPAQIGYESIDAATFAKWGVDYLKYDNCFVPGNWTDQYQACVPDEGGPYPNGTCPDLRNGAPTGYDWSISNTAKRYGIMRDALLAQDRPILYSLCEWGQAHVEIWGSSTAQSWRMSGDITPDWPRIAQIMNENSFLLQYTNFWGHADTDMLEIGNGALTLPESRSHFAFWAAMKSPLLIGTALDVLIADKVAILKNKFLLDFNQDELIGGPATPYHWGVNPDWTFNATHPAEYWSGSSSKGILVLALNTLNESAVREIKWKEVPQLEKTHGGGVASFQVTDIWTGKNLGCIEGGIRKWVASHDTIGYLIGAKCSILTWW